MINKFFNYIVTNFGFTCTTDFNSSIVHSKLLIITLPIAAISSVIEKFMGIQGLTVLAFILLVILELVTGLAAAKGRGEKIQSHKFSRFGLKIFVWMSLLFITHSLRLEYVNKDGVLSNLIEGFFTWLHGTLFVYITLEYLISVLENLSSLTSEKSKKNLITVIINKLNSSLGIEKLKK